MVRLDTPVSLTFKTRLDWLCPNGASSSRPSGAFEVCWPSLFGHIDHRENRNGYTLIFHRVNTFGCSILMSHVHTITYIYNIHAHTHTYRYMHAHTYTSTYAYLYNTLIWNLNLIRTLNHQQWPYMCTDYVHFNRRCQNKIKKKNFKIWIKLR